MGGYGKKGEAKRKLFPTPTFPFLPFPFLLLLLLLSFHFALIILVFVAAINYRRREGGKEWESGVRKRADYNGVSSPLSSTVSLPSPKEAHCSALYIHIVFFTMVS